VDKTTSTATKLSDVTAPHFSIITKAIGGSTDDDGHRRFRATASSTITDRAGDEISLKALQQMAATFRSGVTIFTDHENKVANAFGRTDAAEIVQRGNDPKSGAAVWDLDISGPVNEPNPNAVQLHESIAGGYVQLGCSIDAFVLEHDRKKAGGLSIDGLDVYAASIVGVPMNQRSWTQKAVRAIKSFYGEPEEEDDSMPPENTSEATEAVLEAVEPIEKVAEATDIPLGVPETSDDTAAPVQDEEEAPVEKAASCPDCGKDKAAEGCSNDFHDTDLDGKDIESAADESVAKSTSEDGQEADPAATPETASDTTPDVADPAPVQKAIEFEAGDVVELVKHVQTLVGHVGQRDEKIAAMTTELSEVTMERDRLAAENKEAQAVIEKIMAMPLRPKTVGYVADFSERLPDFLAPEVKKFLTKTAGDSK